MNNRAMSLPENWQFRPFGDIVISSQYGLSDKTSSHGTPILGMSSITAKGTLVAHAESFVEIDKEVELRYKLRALDLLFNRTNSLALVGKTAIVPTDLPHVFASYLVRFKLSSEVDAAFVHAFFNLGRSVQCLKSLATPGVSQFNINPTQLMRYFHVAIPPLPEQKKIARTLSTWDRAIEIVERLIEAKERQKKGLMQLLLTGKKRLGGSAGIRFAKTKAGTIPTDWDHPRAGSLFASRRERNGKHLPVLSVTQTEGVVRRDQLDRKIATSGDTRNYKVVEPGDFIISLRSFQGGIELSRSGGLVSPAYTVLRTQQGIDEQYFRYLFKSPDFISRLGVAVIGIRDGKQINFNDFAAMQIPVPSTEEQRRIAAVLSTADQEIRVLTRYRGAIARQKRGLMQQLLTGQIRVNIDNWEEENGE